MTLGTTSHKPRIFYGWYALTGAMLASIVGAGAFGFSIGVFLPVMCADFGWSRAALASVMSVGALCFGLPSPLIGFLVARFGARIILILGGLITGVGLSLMFFVQEIWQVYIFFSLTGLGAGIGGYIPTTTLVNDWFIKKRPLVMGILLGSTNLGGFIFPLLLTALISSVGWRMAWVIIGGIVVIGGSLLGGFILVRNKPEDIGQVPDGISQRSAEELKTIEIECVSNVNDTQEGWTTKQALKQPATWLIAAFTAANLFAFQTMTAHQVAYMQDSGFTPMVSAMSLSILSITAIVGSLVFGILALKIRVNILTSVCFLIRLIALGILLTTDNLFIIYVYSILFGVSSGAIISAMPIMMSAYYGRANYAQIMGFLFALQTLAGAAGPAAAGAIYDATSSYTLAFYLLIVFSLAGLICAFQARQPRLPKTQG